MAMPIIGGCGFGPGWNFEKVGAYANALHNSTLTLNSATEYHKK
jgi:hypothetical protein